MNAVLTLAMRIGTVVAVALSMSSCQVVGSQSLVEVAMLSAVDDAKASKLDRVRCTTRLGSYSLSKSLLAIKVYREGAYHSIELDPVPKRVAENRHTFCLDHLASAFADDLVFVSKTRVESNGTVNTAAKPTPFLQLIASKAVDQTANIVRKLIRTAFILISGNPDVEGARVAIGGTGSEIVRDLAFDPFDQHELAEINESIGPLGLCVVLGDYSFNTNAISAARYCSAPGATVRQHPSPKADHAARQRYLVPQPSSGVFYRPRADYPVSIYVRKDPGSDPWRLAHVRYMPFENISPIISVGVGRAAFATRRTALVFDDGVLTDVCITKGSEAAGFINIPLDIVYGIIALPSQTIVATVRSNTTRRQLIEAQNDLVKAQQAYIDYLANADYTAAPDIKKDEASALKLGTITNPKPEQSSAKGLADYGLSGDTQLIFDDTKLTSICGELAAANTALDLKGEARF